MKKFAYMKSGVVKAISEFSRDCKLPFYSHAIPFDNVFPAKSNLKFEFLPFQHLRNLEIEVTTKCNLKCINCDRRCRQAPSNEEISIKQLEHFVEETRSTKYPWKRITILGGEPSLHSDILRVIEVLKKLNVRLEFVTNGYGIAKNIESIIPPYVKMRNTRKKSQHQSHFVHVDSTIIERPQVEKIISCSHVDICGLGMTRYGFYPCGPGASIDRVLGFDIGIKKISDITISAINFQQRILCPYCGWSESRHAFPPPKQGYISTFWKKAYDAYSKDPVKLSLYG